MLETHNKQIPKQAVLSSDLKGNNQSMGIAQLISKARKNNLKIIHKKEVQSLRETSMFIVAANMQLYKSLPGLDKQTRQIIYDMVEIQDNLEEEFSIIQYDNYWKRACQKHFRLADVHMHGNSWKQCYAENYVKQFLLEYSADQDIRAPRLFNLMKHHVFNLEVKYFQSSFDISLISRYFVNLTRLELKYSPKLRESSRESIYTKKIKRKTCLFSH